MAARPLVSHQGHLLKYPLHRHMTGVCLARIIYEQANINKRNPSEHGCRGISENDKKDAAMSAVVEPQKKPMKAPCRPKITNSPLNDGERCSALDI